jgi:hypothetical protein
MRCFSTTLIFVATSVVATSFSTSTAFADRRMFTSTYEYKTVPEGHTALELWHTESRATWDDDSPHAMTEILELEHGLTDHWDAALYTVFTQVGSADPTIAQPLSLHEMKVESRYRFADRGELPVDIMAYGEVAREFGGGAYELEAKAILARDFDKLLIAANLIGAVELGSDVPETEAEFGWAVGATYEVHPKLNIGVETFGEIEEEEVAASVGPAIAVAPSGNFWFTFTAGFGLTDEAPKLSGRLIVGVEL